jgi:hypothetical protein
MHPSRRATIVVLAILTTISVVGLLVTPASAAVGPNPPGSTAPGNEPDLGYNPPPRYNPSYELFGSSVEEGDPGDTNVLTFEFVSSHPIDHDVVFQAEVFYGSSATTATPGVDFVPGLWDVTIHAGETSSSFGIEIIGDLVPEADEQIHVLVYKQGNNVATADAIGTILDDDPHVSYSLADAQVYEGGLRGLTYLTFVLTASEALDYDVTFYATTQSGTALPGEDYVALSYKPVVLAAGQTSLSVQVQVIGDTVVEDDETLTLQLYRLDLENTWHVIQATGTILDDDLKRI